LPSSIFAFSSPAFDAWVSRQSPTLQAGTMPSSDAGLETLPVLPAPPASHGGRASLQSEPFPGALQAAADARSFGGPANKHPAQDDDSNEVAAILQQGLLAAQADELKDYVSALRLYGETLASIAERRIRSQQEQAGAVQDSNAFILPVAAAPGTATNPLVRSGSPASSANAAAQSDLDKCELICSRRMVAIHDHVQLLEWQRAAERRRQTAPPPDVFGGVGRAAQHDRDLATVISAAVRSHPSGLPYSEVEVTEPPFHSSSLFALN
jgi:hypothetical protein